MTTTCCSDMKGSMHNDPVTRKAFEQQTAPGPTAPGMDTPCLIWTGCKGQDGYGKFGSGWKTWRAHRWAWASQHGDPAELLVCHRCDVPLCVRSDHLFLGTPRDNTRDMIQKGRKSKVAARGTIHGSAKLSEADVYEIRRIGRAQSTAVIAIRFGLNRTGVWRILQRVTWVHLPARDDDASGTPHDNRKRGEASPNARLTETTVIEVLQARGRERQRDTGKRLNLCQQTVSDIQRGKSWAHVEQQNSVRKLLGLPPIIDVTPTPTPDAEEIP